MIETAERLLVFTDGGARGNPGPAAAAFLILTEKNLVLTKDSRYIGERTNNQAEYCALILALEAAAMYKPEVIICHTDSELMAKQLKGEFAVKNPTLKQLWQKVKRLEKNFNQVIFINLPRSDKQIQEVDNLVNFTLNSRSRV